MIEAEKLFLINHAPDRQSVNAWSMGRILMRTEVSDIVRKFGSEAKQHPSNVFLVDIVPPIPKDRLPQLGEALVQLAHTLDSTNPMPTYDIDYASEED